MMEVSGAAVTRSGSFRKRRLEARHSDGTDLPTKHERAPSETEMDYSSSPTILAPAGPNTVQDEIEQHFQRSLAKVRTQQQQNQQPQQASKPLVVFHPPHPSEKQKHSHQPQPTTQQSSQPALRTILPKPHPSDAHDIIVTENSLIASNKVLMTPAAISSCSDTPQALTTSIRTLQNATTGLSQPIVISASQAGHIITTSSPIISTATQSGVQIIDLTRNLAQKYSTSGNTGQRTVLTATTVPLSSTTTSQKGAVTVPSLIQMTQSSVAQPKKAPIPPVSTGAQTTKTETPRTKNTGPTQLPSTPTLITPQPPTPTLTPTLTPKQMMPLLDPTTSQLVAGAAGSSPVILLPAGGNVSLMQTQPFILVNPTDLSSLQQATTASTMVGRNPSFINAAAAMGSVIPTPSGGYIVIPPGTTFPTPLMNLAGVNGSQQQAMATTSTTQTAQQPASLSATQPPTAVSQSTATITTVNPLKRSSQGRIPNSSDQNDVMNMTPASVEDHFAKALGEKWSQLQNNGLQSQTVTTAHRL